VGGVEFLFLNVKKRDNMFDWLFWLVPSFHDATLGIAAILGWKTGEWLVRRRRMPYRWKCPQCDFKIQSSTRDVYEISKSSHNHISTKEYK